MPVDLSGRVIFLASPAGMDAERCWVREEVALFNNLRFRGTGVVFVVTGYEDVPGTANRPQAAINPLVKEADFIILLVGDQLGSPTTATAPFCTGIEEELSFALQCLEAKEDPMRDIMLGFRTHTLSALRHPAPALLNVLEFKNVIESTKELFYVGDIASQTDLRHKVRVQLEAWVRPFGAKSSRSCPKLMAALNRSDRPKVAEPPQVDAGALVQWAEEQAGRGLNTVADSAFAKVVAYKVPDHLRRYGRFLQRTGQLERAVEVDKQALNLCVGLTAVEDVRLQADLLAHLAQLKRKLGDPVSSKKLLDEAATTARPYASQISSTLAYILDQSGIAATRIGDLNGAKAVYTEAHALRVAADDDRGRAQSLINLARVASAQGEIDQAASLLKEAIEILGTNAETRVLANALAATGELLLESDPERALDYLTRSLQINERLDVPDGVSVASNGLARLALSMGNVESATKHAERVLEVNGNTGNREGTGIAYRLFGEIHLASGKPRAAAEAFENALSLASAQHDPAREAQAYLGLARSWAASGQRERVVTNIELGRMAASRASDKTLVDKFNKLNGST